MPACKNIDYVNYFISLNTRSFGAHGLHRLPVGNYGTIEGGAVLHILTIFVKDAGWIFKQHTMFRFDVILTMNHL